MHRFYLSPDNCAGGTLRLTDREAHHASRVLRLQRGERVTVLDGAGVEFLCEVIATNRNAVELNVVEKKIHPPLPHRITLLQAIPKGKIIEDIIEKATELGAHRIVPILSERVTMRVDDAGTAEKGEKWQQVAIEAIKQCGSPWLPRVDAPITLQQFLARNDMFELPLVASLHGDQKSARVYFQSFRVENGRLPGSVCIWIGPEGDLTAGEVQAIRARGALPITLGPLVLRCETAATYCLSVVNHELQSQP